MIQLEIASAKLAQLRQLISEVGSALNLEGLSERLRELHAEMEDPEFWNQLEHAQKINREVSGIEGKIKAHGDLAAQADDIEVLIELAGEEDDDTINEEIEEGLKKLEEEATKLHLMTLLNGEYDANNAILTLHAGAGGTEAQDWTSMLYRMYTRYCERKGFSVKVMDYLDGDEAGIKSVTFLASGLNAYGFLKSEKGVHRLVRISPFDSNARRHTSFASLEVMPEIDDSDSDIVINPEDLKVDTYRSSGAGGQHINKTESAIRITHIPTGVVVSCQTERSQIQNRETAMRMLRSRLAELREAEYMEKLAELHGELKKIEWGSQIRSYVFQPYTMVKDHRTGAETANITAVMDGDLDMFIEEYLKKL